MTLNKHPIYGLPKFDCKTMPAEKFDSLMLASGYTQIGSGKGQGKRIKIWWIHDSYPRVESIYSEDKQTVITAYHINP